MLIIGIASLSLNEWLMGFSGLQHRAPAMCHSDSSKLVNFYCSCSCKIFNSRGEEEEWDGKEVVWRPDSNCSSNN